jgi:hypothetical protein
MRAAYGVEVGGFYPALSKVLVWEGVGGDWVEGEIERVSPVELEVGLADGVVVVSGSWLAGKCGGWNEKKHGLPQRLSASGMGGNAEVGGRSAE